MGRDKHELGQGHISQKQAKSGKPRVSFFYSVHPTEAEKDQINRDAYGITEALAAIGQKVEEGHKLTLSYSQDRGVFCAMIVEMTEDWRTAIKLTAFHVNPVKALVILGIGLEFRYAGFPSLGSHLNQMEFGW